MGRLAWLVALAAGPLAAMLLVAQQRAPMVSALAEATAGSEHGDLARMRAGVAQALAAQDCFACNATDRAQVAFAQARLFEADGKLSDAQSRYEAVTRGCFFGRVHSGLLEEAQMGSRRAAAGLQAREDEEKRLEAKRLAPEPPAPVAPVVPKVTNAALVIRAGSAIETGDAQGALQALSELDDDELDAAADVREKALLVGGQAASLQKDNSRVDEYFRKAVTLDLDHDKEAWSDPSVPLRLWATQAGSRPCPSLMAMITEAESVLATTGTSDSITRRQRVQLLEGEALAARGHEVEAARVLYEATNNLSSFRPTDSQQITRDMVLLADIETRQKNYSYAALHYRDAAKRLDAEVTPVRERSEAWRKLANLYKTHPEGKSSLRDAVRADQSALAAVVNVLEVADAEVLRDRLELGWTLLRAHDDAGAGEQVTAIEHATHGTLGGDLGANYNALKVQVAMGSRGLEARMSKYTGPHFIGSVPPASARGQ